MRTIRFAPLAFALALSPLLGCSDDTEGGTSAAASSTSGGDAATGPRAALAMEVYATQAQTCPPGNVHIDIGNPKTNPAETVADGVSGAKVTCHIVAEGDAFAADGSVVAGTSSFTFGDLLTDGMASATGSVSFLDPASGDRYASTMAKPCVFEFLPSAGNAISAGQLSVGFNCSELAKDSDAAASCSARFGALLLEGCSEAP